MRYTAGQKVSKGFYWSPVSGDQVKVDEGEQVLPGAEGTRFYRLPGPAMLVVGPLLGFMLVVFLPVIGIVLTAKVAGEAAWKGMKKVSEAMGHVATSPELIGQAALTKKEDKDEDAEAVEEEKELADEVAARRTKGEK